MALFNFGKKKDPVPAPSAKVTTFSDVDPDDFFKDMGRKPKAPKGVAEIASPEITGLHDEPLPRPVSTIKNYTAAIDTDSLEDKSLLPPDANSGNIKKIDTETLNTDVIPKEKKILRSAPKPVSADDFFADLDRKRPRSIDIDLPEVTGLREKPVEHHVTDIGDAAVNEAAAAALKDKSHEIPDFVVGDINTIDVTKLDMSSLRD